ncbi:putative solute carrier family 35 member G1-like [Apostichopus japonicus]|uniref:Putative solute carrier family 35 member G1-like n=1 Tax=Stichopus japonicus TaxID=307972 RepID=A0A2G8K5N3_STIJA|nr:putative solute carrier family 35 member G1-like [Apostichopus japonicus]
MATERAPEESFTVNKILCLKETWDEYRGIAYAVASAISFSISDLLIYESSNISHPLIIYLWISAWMFILSTAFLLVKRPYILYTGTNSIKLLLTLTLNGLMVATGDVALTVAYVFTSPGDAVSINYTAPIYAGIFSVILLRDRCRVWDIIFIILSVIDVFLVVKPTIIFDKPLADTDVSYSIGIGLAIFSAIMTGATYVIGSYLGKNDISPLIVLFFTALAEVAISITLCTSFQQWGNITDYSVLQVFKLTSGGVFWFLGSLLVFTAVQIERPTFITIVMTSETFLVFLGGFVFLGLTTLWSKYLGAALIVVDCIGSTAVRDRNTSSHTTADGQGDEELLLEDQN